MKILILYYSFPNNRITINEHLYSFKKYSGEQCFYADARYKIPIFITKINFDLIIYHYTFLSLKWSDTEYFHKFLNAHKILRKLRGYKIAIPQDEYLYSIELCHFLKQFRVSTMYTCLPSSEWDKVYPKKLSGIKHFKQVLTGYVDERKVCEYTDKLISHQKRTTDIGYRARKNPYWLGSHGLIKWQITNKVISAAKGLKLRLDVSNNPKDVFYGSSWYDFLANCRVILGCEGGASLHDPDGKIKRRVDEYQNKFPEASFETVEQMCFPHQDGNLKLYALSPRHFEACTTQTCQALVEGEYNGVFKPGIHYIEIKKDWSNLEHVIKKIKNVEYCENIAKQAYKDIILSGKYTYRRFVEEMISSVPHKRNNTKNENIINSLRAVMFAVYLEFISFIRQRVERIHANVLQPVISSTKSNKKITNFSLQNVSKVQLNLGIRKTLKSLKGIVLHYSRKFFPGFEKFIQRNFIDYIYPLKI